MRNHAREVLACEFIVTVTAHFRLLDVFVVLDVGTRQLMHWNVTEHRTAEWTLQQFRACMTGESSHRFVVHDRDTIHSAAVDHALHAMGLQVLKTPVAAPRANAYCERVIGTARRECVDWVIPLDERHLRRVLAEWVPPYNRARPHTGLGLGFPEPSSSGGVPVSGHQFLRAHRVITRSVLVGSHHEYALEAVAA